MTTVLPLGHVFAGLPLRGAKALLIDPPYNYRNYNAVIGSRDARNHYPTMTRRAILELPVHDLASPEGCHLFLWVTDPFLEFGFELLRAWKFKFSSRAFDWVKLNAKVDPAGSFTLADFHVGMGHTTRKTPEIVLLGRSGCPRRNSGDVRELIISPRREHSRKPDEARERIEQYCDGPYVELFARSSRPGWITWGPESTKFDKPRSDK
jgi:N6-adenosine-specific RNA methylase IME4